MHNVSRFMLLALVGLLCLSGAIAGRITSAQGQNLLQNPGFEGTYVQFAGDPTRLVAPGWSAWNVARKAGDPGFVNLTPEYRPAANSKRIHSGSSAQELFTFFATHTAGVFQRVPLPAGSKARFSAFINVWSTSLDDPNASEQPGRVKVRVGIDPTGGVDGTSPSIVWSAAQEFYDQYKELSVEATSAADFVTVFVESAPADPVKNNNTYIDDASLVVTGQGQPPASNTPVSTTVSQAPTDTPVPVSTQAPSDTPNPFIPTREGTFVPGASETPFPTPEVIPGGPTPTPSIAGTQPPNLPGRIVYTVVAGDTVIDLALRFASTVDAIINANNLDASGLIFVGQQLVIPVPAVQPTPAPTAAPGSGGGQATLPAPVDSAVLNGPTVNGIGTYIVQPGDDLNRIAARYGLSVTALAQLNGIVNPANVVIGQVLVVPGPGNNYPGGSVPPTIIPTSPAPPPVRTHVVQAGENLFRISLRYNVPLDALMRANGIVNPNLVYVGQVLRIP